MSDEEGPSAVVREGTLLGGRWRVKRRVGRGTFSEIYEVSDQQAARDASGRHPHLAIKVARASHAKCSMLLHEEEVLRELPDDADSSFIQKVFTQEDLLRAVREILDKAHT